MKDNADIFIINISSFAILALDQGSKTKSEVQSFLQNSLNLKF